MLKKRMIHQKCDVLGAAFPIALRYLALSAVSSSSVLFAGCVPSFDDDTSRITSNRILGVRVEPAEPKPGVSAQLVALYAGPVADKPPKTEVLTWNACNQRRAPVEPGPVAQECVAAFGTTSDSLEDLGQGAEVEYQLPQDVCRHFGPLAPPVAEGSKVAGSPATPDQTGGYYQPVLLGPEGASTEATLTAVRLFCGGANLPQDELIIFNRGYRPNENPEIDELELRLDGKDKALKLDDAEVAVGAKLNLKVSWAECPQESECGDGLCTAGENATDCAEDCREGAVGCTGAERYLLADPETRRVVEQTEAIEVSWFSTAGAFEASITDNNEQINESVNHWTAPEEPGLVRIWLVVRDSRRGTTWRDFTLTVTD